MRNLKRRLFGWSVSNSETYGECYQLHGGSINTHPDVINFISTQTGADVKYYENSRNGVLYGAYPLINGALGLKINKKYPLSYDEVLLPIRDDKRLFIPERTNRLSPLHRTNTFNSNFIIVRKNEICIVKHTFSAKTEKNRRHEFNRFIKAGGSYVDQVNFSAEELSNINITLFKARFGESVPCYSFDCIFSFINHLRKMIFGYVLYINNTPCALDLILFNECNNFIYFDVPNGGVDPHHSVLSPGSVLMWLNIKKARELCEEKERIMHFSIGALRPRWKYKLRWADPFKTGKPFI